MDYKVLTILVSNIELVLCSPLRVLQDWNLRPKFRVVSVLAHLVIEEV